MPEVSSMVRSIAHTTFLVVSTLMLTLFPVFILPDEASAQGLPEISIVPGPSVVLDVSPSGTGIGQTSVTVYNSAYDASVTVRMTIIASGYMISPQTSTFTIPPNSERMIPVTVATQLRTTYRQATADIHAEVTHANNVPYSGADADAGFLILSQPYAKVILQSDKPFQKVSPGNEYPFKLKVFNNGNAVDMFSIEVLNKDKLHDHGFSISLSSSTTKNTDPSGFDTITIQVQSPRDIGWKNEYYTLDVRALSEIESQSSEYTITIWVYGFGVSGFEPVLSVIALAVVATIIAKGRKHQA